MAYSDWDITGENTPILNASLPYPLSEGVGGSYARQPGASGVPCKMFVGATYQSGAFLGVPSTKMIRAQGMIRRGGNGGGYRGGLFVKHRSMDGFGFGYGLVYDSVPQAFRLYMNNATSNYSVAMVGTVFSPSYGGDWFSVRMDVYPIGTAADQIIISQESSPGSGVWNAVSINGGAAASGYQVLSTSAEYAPWGSSFNPTIGQTISRCGVIGGAIQSQGYIYVDNVVFSVSDAP